VKKILMLGGSHFQIPAIKYAREAGYYVITADYLPDNPGHQYSHEYHNVSTIDRDAVLKLAQDLNINGILSYASDPGAPTAAYVAEKLGLPGNPYRSVEILQRKDLFRKFLKINNLNVPDTGTFSCCEDAKSFVIKTIQKHGTVIVKPVDSSGSKGVTKVNSIDDFDNAYSIAQRFSICNKVIIEQFINKSIYEMDGDGFVWNGKLAFRCFGNQHNDLDCNKFVPTGISFPYIQNKELQDKAHKIIDTILTKLDMKLGGVNIEYLTDDDENIYILEIGPRNGGNLIPEVIKYSTGVDLIALAVESAIGKDISRLEMTQTEGFYSSYILHSKEDGILENITISTDILKNIIAKNVWRKNGDKVTKFNGSNATIGTMILKFETSEEMISKLNNMNDYVAVTVSGV
jgi:biotin carboxylase